MPTGRYLNNKPVPLSPTEQKEFIDECVSVAMMSPEQKERLESCGHTARSFYNGVERTRVEFNKFVNECVAMSPWTTESLAIAKASTFITSHHQGWLYSLALEYLLYQRSRCRSLSLESIAPLPVPAPSASTAIKVETIEEWKVVACGKPTVLRLIARQVPGRERQIFRPEIRPE